MPRPFNFCPTLRGVSYSPHPHEHISLDGCTAVTYIFVDAVFALRHHMKLPRLFLAPESRSAARWDSASN